MLNLNNVKTPGVYIDEVSLIPPSVAAVETAIPAFIGYTEKSPFSGTFPHQAVRITSLVQFRDLFGGPMPETFSAVLSVVSGQTQVALTAPATTVYKMYYSLQAYFANGGGPCFIIPVGLYNTTTPAANATEIAAGLDILKKEDEPTLIVFPDATSITSSPAFYSLYTSALQLCEDRKDLFTIIDIFRGDLNFRQPAGIDVINGTPDGFRARIGTDNLKYGAAYYPWLETNYTIAYNSAEVGITGTDTIGAISAGTQLRNDANLALSLYHRNNAAFELVKAAIEERRVVLPPGPFIAGVYAYVDSTRGVWKSPANVSLSAVNRPLVKIDNDAQDDLNVHTSGKSVNAIRPFTGKGILVWGGRTLAGNDNEWRYINVRRFFNFAEESIMKATEGFIFEPNDANTWVKVRAMIENFLLLQWRDGALAGAKPEDAFFVRIGLGQTMTSLDILEGRMIVEIGMAAVRPAEFIILKFSHKMQVS